MQVFPGVSLNDTITFQLYPATIIWTSFNHCKIVGVLDFDTVNKFIDAAGMHANVYPTLPDRVPDDPTQYSYLKVQLPSGEMTYIGHPWVREDTIEVHDLVRVRFTVANMSIDDAGNLEKILATLGYTAVDWETIH